MAYFQKHRVKKYSLEKIQGTSREKLGEETKRMSHNQEGRMEMCVKCW
jgi:hypothetical protein